MEASLQTEQLILNAARNMFTRKGFAAARMQEIADEAGINRALLHYYFRSKEKLFEKIFSEAIEQIFPNIQSILNKNEPVLDKIQELVSFYIDFGIANPYLPAFVIHELNQHPDRFLKLLGRSKQKPNLEKFIAQLQSEVKAGKINSVKPLHLVINIISLCLFPFIAKPMMNALLGISDKAYKDFIKERKKVVSETIINAIKKR